MADVIFHFGNKSWKVWVMFKLGAKGKRKGESWGESYTKSSYGPIRFTDNKPDYYF